MKVICLVGPCYCGKTHFIEHCLNKDGKASVIHLGQYFRQQKFNGVYVGPEILAKTIDYLFHCEHLHDTVIIDNAFKDVYQAEAVLKLFNKEDVDVYWMNDCRSKVDYTTRGREDDCNISGKLSLWRQNCGYLLKYLQDNNYHLVNVNNTDGGYVVEDK